MDKFAIEVLENRAANQVVSSPANYMETNGHE